MFIVILTIACACKKCNKRFKKDEINMDTLSPTREGVSEAEVAIPAMVGVPTLQNDRSIVIAIPLDANGVVSIDTTTTSRDPEMSESSGVR